MDIAWFYSTTATFNIKHEFIFNLEQPMKTFNLSFILIRNIFFAGFCLLTASQSNASATYNISLNGSTIDLSGFIETSALGTFSPTEFRSQLTDYSINASYNGTYAYIFNLANSTWGNSNYMIGSNVSITVSATEIVLSASTGQNYAPENTFLLANVVTNGAGENLRLFQDQLGYRTPNPPDASPLFVIFETVPISFVLATASPVPTPSAAWLLGSGLLGLIGVARRKAT